MNRKEHWAERHPHGVGTRRASTPQTVSPALQPLLNDALRHHQNGRLKEAEKLYRRALDIDPYHADGLHLLGMVAHQTGRDDIAVALITKAIAQNRRAPMFHNTLGVALKALGKLDEAAASCRRAIALQSDYPEAHNNLGIALKDLGKLDEAVTSYRRAIALRPDFAEAHNNLATALKDLGNLDEAVSCYEKALALKPEFVEAHNGLGIVLAEQGRLDEAAASYRRALTHLPHPRYYYNLAALKRFEAGDSDLAAMEGLAKDMASLPDQNRIALHFALGKAYDDCGDTGRAFDHFRQGNALKRAELAYDEAATLDVFDRIGEVFSASLMAAMGALGDPSSQPIFILGMPRSGSTLVEQILASHPQVAGGGERRDWPQVVVAHGLKPGYPESAATLSWHGLRRFGAAYAARLRQVAPEAARITDKMPTNFLYAGLIHLALPNARIIHTRRDAVDTCLSCFFTLFSEGQAHTYDLGELGRYYAAYDRLMRHWRAVLPGSVMVEVDYEALVADLEGEARRIIGHCGLDWDDACLSFHETRRVIRTASAAQVRQPVYTRSIGRARAYIDFLEPLLQHLQRG